MCTFLVYRHGEHPYYGRNMDIDASFGESIVSVPEGYVFHLKNGTDLTVGYPVLSMASCVQNVPLMADGFNDQGLAGAGLNFPDNAYYGKAEKGKNNLAPYEVLWYILGTCTSVKEARQALEDMHLIDEPFLPGLPCAPMHFMFADGKESIVAEPMPDGIHIYADPFDVLTNNPPFPYHQYNMINYRSCTAADPENDPSLKPYAAEMGGIGLPGDLSSASRFVRAAFTLKNSVKKEGKEAVLQTFHILDSVKMTEGTVITSARTFDKTIYQAVMDPQEKIYYYRTYESSAVHGVRMKDTFMSIPLVTDEIDVR